MFSVKDKDMAVGNEVPLIEAQQTDFQVKADFARPNYQIVYRLPQSLQRHELIFAYIPSFQPIYHILSRIPSVLFWRSRRIEISTSNLKLMVSGICSCICDKSEIDFARYRCHEAHSAHWDPLIIERPFKYLVPLICLRNPSQIEHCHWGICGCDQNNLIRRCRLLCWHEFLHCDLTIADKNCRLPRSTSRSHLLWRERITTVSTAAQMLTRHSSL